MFIEPCECRSPSARRGIYGIYMDLGSFATASLLSSFFARSLALSRASVTTLSTNANRSVIS